MSAPLSIRVQTLDGGWETLGVERYEGLTPEQVRPSADEMGPSTLSFQLQRDSTLLQPDLSAWTPCEVEVAGKIIWDGRIKETPTQKGAQSVITVNGIGWQSHLDDDALELYFVHQDLTQWQDARANANSNLQVFTASPTITTGNGSLAILLPAGQTITANTWAAVTLDLGLNNTAADCFVDATFTGAPAGGGILYYIRTMNAPYPTGAYSDAPGSGSNISNGTASSLGGIFATSQRYVFVFLYVPYALTPTADVTMSITRILVGCNVSDYTQSGESSGAAGTSDLRASDVILNKVKRCCPLITATPRSGSYASEVLCDKPVSYWRLGNTPITAQAPIVTTSTSTATATIGSNDPSMGTVDWTSPNSFAAGTLVRLMSGQISHYLLATGFNFGIPPGATILGVQAQVTLMNAFTTGPVYEWSVQLFAYGAHAGTNRNYSRVVNNTPGSLLTYGAANDLWGATLSAQDVNSPTFGVGVAVQNNQRIFNSQATVDVVSGVQITITYTLRAVATPLTDDFGSANNVLAAVTGGSPQASLLIDDNDQALAFNGAATVVAAPSNAAYQMGVQGMSCEALVLTTALGTLQTICRRETQWVLQIDTTGRLYFYIGTVTNGPFALYWTASTPLAANVIYHIIAAYTPGGAISMQVNGLLAAGTLTGAGTGAMIANSNPVYIGSVLGTSQFWNGTIDEVSLYNYVLSPVQQQNHYLAARARQYGGVTRTQFKLLHYAPSGAQTAHQDITAVNALHNYQVKVPVGRTLLYAPQATSALLRVGPNVDFSDSGANDGEVVYNRCIVEGSDATGQPVRVTLTASQINPSAPTIVDRRGFYRTKILQASAAIDQATATVLATAFLQSSMSTPFRGSFIASSPEDVILLPSETNVHQSELVIYTGQLVQIPVVDPDTGDFGRDGKIVTVAYDADLEQATVTVDDDRNNLQALMSRMSVVSQAFGV